MDKPTPAVTPPAPPPDVPALKRGEREALRRKARQAEALRQNLTRRKQGAREKGKPEGT